MAEKKKKEITDKELDGVAGGYGDLDFIHEERKPNFDPDGSTRLRKPGDND